ncbi:hypothetical protein ERJ75_000593700 [Trypanosoma vivax]|nr:hypothetical protein ERJ75_000593700 [Trypanosoma vivax]
MLASDNGKVFCEVVGQFLKSDKELKEMEKNVMDAKRTAANAVSDSEQVLPEAVTMDKVVKDVVTRLRGDYLTLVRKFPMTSNLEVLPVVLLRPVLLRMRLFVLLLVPVPPLVQLKRILGLNASY